MNEFPKLKGSVRADMQYCIDNGFSARKMLLERGFSPHIKEGDYVVNTKDVTTLPELVLRMYEHGEMCLLADNGVKHVLFVGDGLAIPGEYLVWSDGKDNKTVPLNCESLSIDGPKDPMLEQEGLCQEIPLPLTKEEEYVTCIDNRGGDLKLTVGKEYKPVHRAIKGGKVYYIRVIDDEGRNVGVNASRFTKEDKGKDHLNFNFNIKEITAYTFEAAVLRIREKLEKGDIKFDIDDRGEGTPTKAYSALQTPPASNTTYVVCPTTGRKLDPNTLIPLDEVVTFTDKSII